MLIAVTSSNGIDVDTHFGKAERFLIYEVGTGEPALLHAVETPSYCSGAAPGHSLMPDKLAAISQALGDCRVVVTAMIGEAPQQELERLGIAIVPLAVPVTVALREVAKLY
jgi:predicted Fe-Mo cluster-binding NifX family protein